MARNRNQLRINAPLGPVLLAALALATATTVAASAKAADGSGKAAGPRSDRGRREGHPGYGGRFRQGLQRGRCQGHSRVMGARRRIRRRVR